MADSIYPSTDGVPTFSAKELQNLTYTDSSGEVHPYPFPGAGAGVVQDFDGTVVDQLAYEKDQDVGFTHPNLHRRIVRQDPETDVNSNLLGSVPNFYESDEFLVYQIPLTENLIAGKEYTLQLWDVNISYIDVMPSEGRRLFVFWGGKKNYECAVEVPDGHVDHAVITFVANNSVNLEESNNLWINIYDGFAMELASNQRNIRIGCWKLELGSTATPLNKELAPREYTLQIHGVDSYRTTEIFVHDEESITTEIP